LGAIISSWKRIRAQLVEKGNPYESLGSSQDALVGVLVSASQRGGHTGAHGLLDEDGGSNDDDEPDD